MVIKKKEGILGEGEIKPFTKEELEAWKWPIRIFLILAISVFIGWSVYTTPGLMNSIFAKTATDASVVKPPSGDTVNLLLPAGTPQPTAPLISAEDVKSTADLIAKASQLKPPDARIETIADGKTYVCYPDERGCIEIAEYIKNIDMWKAREKAVEEQRQRQKHT